MKRAVAETSIEAYYTRVVPRLAAGQNERVIAACRYGRDYSLSELMQIVPGIDKSSMSRVVNNLRAAGRLKVGKPRKCSVTGVTIIPSRLPPKQLSLLEAA